VAATLQHDAGNRYRLQMSGRITSSEWTVVEQQAAAEIVRSGTIRLLVDLRGFAGWEGTDWSNLAFYVRHGESVERIAIVGDETWRSEALMFAGADLRKAAVAYFRPAEADGARAWLTAA
jgi:uncharacterized small protein (DUF1192 family)